MSAGEQRHPGRDPTRIPNLADGAQIPQSRRCGARQHSSSRRRAFLEGLFLDIYTAPAPNDGTVAQFIEEVLAFPHKQKTEDLRGLPRRLP